MLAAGLLFAAVSPALARMRVVTNTADDGSGSLRATLAGAAHGDTITFAVSLPGTINLTSGELLVNRSLTILGPATGGLTLNANYNSRVLRIAPGNIVTLGFLNIRNGDATGNLGGGILNDHATLTVQNCTFTASTADFGGAILNNGHIGRATLTVRDSTFHGNWAGMGGALYNYGLSGSATMEVNNCTLSGNTAIVYGGGAIFSDGRTGVAPVRINSCTFAGNIDNSGTGVGGLYIFLGSVTELRNSILRHGSVGVNVLVDSGTLTSLGHNLSSDATGPNNGTTDRRSVDPLLGPLQDNGGISATHALLPTSPAIDKGNPGILATDQRGRLRPFDLPEFANAAGGNGGDIGAFEWQSPTFNLTPSMSGNDLILRFESESGRRYRIGRRDTMSATVWTTMWDNLIGTGKIVTVTNVGAGSRISDYYRGEVLPP